MIQLSMFMYGFRAIEEVPNYSEKRLALNAYNILK
jgi:hypothetical protein